LIYNGIVNIYKLLIEWSSLVMKNIKKKLAIILSMLCVVGTTGCNLDDINIEARTITDSNGEHTISIEFIPSVVGNEFWDTAVNGAKDAEYELGINVIVDAPATESDVEGQINIIENAIANNVDAIVLSPLDGTALIDVLTKATEAGIEIITINSSVDYDDILSMVSTRNDEAAELGANEMANLIDYSGDIMVMSFTASATDDNTAGKQRLQGFVDNITTSESTSNINIKDILYCSNDRDTAKQLALEYLDKNPKIKGIYATNQIAAEGVCDAIAEKGLQGQIVVVGWDSSEDEISYIENGVLNVTLVQNPYLFGYLGVRNATKAVEGEIIDDNINTGIKPVELANLQDNDVQVLLNPPEPIQANN
jgi:ribose transport system substrate-binding protein